MNSRIAVFSVSMGIAIGSFCIGQGKPAVKSQVISDIKMSDHDKIEKLPGEVAELQKKVAELTQKYNMHTHQLQNLNAAQLPDSIECDQTVVRWSPAGNPDSVDRVCRQLMSRNVRVLVQGKELTVTGPPQP